MMHERNQRNAVQPTILCVDDEPEVVDALARQLYPFNVCVKKALNGMQGIWMACTEDVDLVVTDLMMPFANGIELVDVLGDIPVIALTGVRDPATRRQLLDAGAVAVLFKPFNSDQLIAEIEKLLPLERRHKLPTRTS